MNIHTIILEKIVATRLKKRSDTAPRLPTYGGPVVTLCNIPRNQCSVVTDYLRVEKEQHPQSGRSKSTGSRDVDGARGRGGRRTFSHLSAVGAAPAAEQREHRGMVERRPSVTGTGTRGLIRFEWK